MIQQDLFDAHLIGDGSLLYRTKACKFPSFTLTNKHKSYLEWVSSQMDIFKDRPIWKRSYFDTRTNKTYECYHMVALLRKEFLLEYQRAYTNGVKDIPIDINVSREFLLHWYLDDGSLATMGGIYLAVDSYSLERINILKEKLEQLVNVKFSVHKNGKGHRLYLPKKHRETFLSFIGDCPVNEYLYKWG